MEAVISDDEPEPLVEDRSERDTDPGFLIYDENNQLVDCVDNVVDALDTVRRQSGYRCIRRASDEVLLAVRRK